MQERPKNQINNKIFGGHLEILVENIRTLNDMTTSLPFPLIPESINDNDKKNNLLPNEEKRLKYRCLDLRRGKLQRNLRLQLSTSAPPTNTSSGTKGDVVKDDNYLYICVETNVWIRSSIGTAW